MGKNLIKNKMQEIVTICLLTLILILITILYLRTKALEESVENIKPSTEQSQSIKKQPFRQTVYSPTNKSSEEIKIEETSVEESSDVNNDSDTKKFKVGEECEVPDIPTHVKFCTDYRSYNLWYTPHYRLQQVAWTDEYGMRRYGDDYLVALGSYYSTDIGDRFEVTLDTGKTFTVMMADGKWDIDCDENNMYTPCIDYNGEYAGNLLEFIMDKYSVSNEMYSYGSLDYHEEFKGSVVKMVYLGRDDSADWDTYY